MKKEQIQEFTRRISQSNRGGLVLVIYDILFAYLSDAKEAYQKEEWEEYKEALRHAQRAVNELLSSLNYSYQLAENLNQIYVFCSVSLSKAMYKRSIEEMYTAERLLEKLYDAFSKTMTQDTSAPLMRNTQQVYAGYTYGKDDLVETCQDFDTSRGFFV